MEVLTAVLGADGPTVPIKHGIVGDLNFVVEIDELLNVLVFVFHMVPLPNIADYSGVEALDQEFEASNSEGVTRLEIVVFLRLKHLVEST